MVPIVLLLIVFCVSGGLAGSRAKRKGDTPFDIALSAIVFGFITMTVVAVLGFGALMVMWGLSI